MVIRASALSVKTAAGKKVEHPSFHYNILPTFFGTKQGKRQYTQAWAKRIQHSISDPRCEQHLIKRRLGHHHQ
jgi:hypothetical protein